VGRLDAAGEAASEVEGPRVHQASVLSTTPQRVTSTAHRPVAVEWQTAEPPGWLCRITGAAATVRRPGQQAGGGAWPRSAGRARMEPMLGQRQRMILNFRPLIPALPGSCSSTAQVVGDAGSRRALAALHCLVPQQPPSPAPARATVLQPAGGARLPPWSLHPRLCAAATTYIKLQAGEASAVRGSGALAR